MLHRGRVDGGTGIRVAQRMDVEGGRTGSLGWVPGTGRPGYVYGCINVYRSATPRACFAIFQTPYSRRGQDPIIINTEANNINT